ncbi:hypothetical protein IKQ38_02540 [Candidatus Saccharibacteria bacterium]|nr:hypothetical protein [Candidatus Saccharibacteria bacterium]
MPCSIKFLKSLVVIAAIIVSSITLVLIPTHEASAENMMCECTNTYSDGS